MQRPINKLRVGEIYERISSLSPLYSLSFPTGHSYPLGRTASQVDELPKDQDLMVIYRSGNRSQVGCVTFLAVGYSSIISVDGCMNTWAAAGYPSKQFENDQPVLAKLTLSS